jgi:hypothetical protein
MGRPRHIFTRRQDTTEAKARTEGEFSVLALRHMDGTAISLRLDRDLTEEVHRLLGEQLAEQDAIQRDLDYESRQDLIAITR